MTARGAHSHAGPSSNDPAERERARRRKSIADAERELARCEARGQLQGVDHLKEVSQVKDRPGRKTYRHTHGNPGDGEAGGRLTILQQLQAEQQHTAERRPKAMSSLSPGGSARVVTLASQDARGTPRGGRPPQAPDATRLPQPSARTKAPASRSASACNPMRGAGTVIENAEQGREGAWPTVQFDDGAMYQYHPSALTASAEARKLSPLICLCQRLPSLYRPAVRIPDPVYLK